MANKDNMIDLDAILKIGVAHHASDIHLSSGCFPMMRVDGELIEFSQDRLDAETLQEALQSITPNKNSQEECDFSYTLKNLARFRVNCFSQLRGISAVFRIIPDNILSLEAIKAPSICHQLITLSRGLILITGPTGSGKSTTLTALIDAINQDFKKHIITLENPIEFIHKNKKCMIHQREIGEHTSNVDTALRATLREDPDVIVIGEMRENATIRLALTAAETGHLVLATLHTNSAIETIDRIIHSFPGDEQSFIRHMLSLSLSAVIAQTLQTKKSGGREAVFEVLVANTAVRNLIRENKLPQLSSFLVKSSS